MSSPRQVKPSIAPKGAALPRPITGSVAQRRSREARIERGVLGAFVLLALTASGFAAYAITGGSRPYAVQALLPAEIRTFAWQRETAAERASIPPIDLDPTTTGAIPERRSASAPASDAPEQAADSAYTLRRVSGSVAVLARAGGAERSVTTGSDLPGAGRVLAIRNTGAGWVVITTETIIGPARL